MDYFTNPHVCRGPHAKPQDLHVFPFYPASLVSSCTTRRFAPDRIAISHLLLLYASPEIRRGATGRWMPPTAAPAPGAAPRRAPSRTSSRTTAPAAPPSSAPSPTVRSRAPAVLASRHAPEHRDLILAPRLAPQTSRSSTRSAIQVSPLPPLPARSLRVAAPDFDLGTAS
jgi:hypothetical protein